MRYAVKPKEAKEVKWMRRCLDVIIASIEAQSWQLCDLPSRDGGNHWRKRFTLNALQVVTHGNEKVVLLGDHEVFRDVHEVTEGTSDLGPPQASRPPGAVAQIWIELFRSVVSFPSLTRSGKVHFILLSSKWRHVVDVCYVRTLLLWSCRRTQRINV